MTAEERAEWDKRRAAEDAKQRAALDEAKLKFAAEFAALGITHVTAEYSGSGDEGFIDDVTANKLKEGEELDTDRCEYFELPDELEERFKDFCYEEVLDYLHGGWMDGNGANGKIVFNIAEKKLSIEHNAIVEEYDTSKSEL
jgi:hypothetical protein